MKKLDFIVIGAAKSGTTSLYQYLKGHPQLFLPEGKELPFFALDGWYDRGYEWYVEEHFREVPDGALMGTVSPQYMLGPEVPGRISAVCPNAKLIALLRNPVDRAVSDYWHLVRLGSETRSLEEAMHHLMKEGVAAEFRALSFGSSEIHNRYLVRSEYGRILSAYLDLFSPENLLVLFTEDLKSDPSRVVNQICSFLGVSAYTPPNAGKTYHKGGGQQRFPGLVDTVSSSAILRWLWNILPVDKRRSVLHWYKTELNVASAPPPELDAGLRQRMVGFFASDVKRLENLIGAPTPWHEYRNPIELEHDA